MAPICQNILLCNVYYSSNSFRPACMSDIIKWSLVSTGGNAYSKNVYEYPLIKQTALDSKYTPQILQMSCVSTYSSGTRMYINTCVTQRIINLKKKILPYCYVKPQQNGHPLHQNRPGISICWKCWVRTCDTSKPCLFTFSTAILHTWSKDQVRNQTIPKIRTTLCVIQQLCILKVQKHSTYLQHQHTHQLFWLLSDLVPPHRCQIRCTRSDM